MRDTIIGIYEKALPPTKIWEQLLQTAAETGYQFIEIAIDESDERMARLDWSKSELIELQQAIHNTHIPIYSIVLSAHRKFPLGSNDPEIRKQGLNILRRTLDFALVLGIRVVQLAGYYVFYEAHTERNYDHFVDALAQGLEWASQRGIMLAIENVDGQDILSVEQAMHFVELFNSPWLQVYPDIGNLAANGFDAPRQLQLAQGHLVGVHLKETRLKEFRRIPFSEGIVPFVDVFKTLNHMQYRGPFLIEMWNDGSPDSSNVVIGARQWIEQQMQIAGYPGV